MDAQVINLLESALQTKTQQSQDEKQQKVLEILADIRRRVNLLTLDCPIAPP